MKTREKEEKFMRLFLAIQLSPAVREALLTRSRTPCAARAGALSRRRRTCT